jgi:hypothetical protein
MRFFLLSGKHLAQQSLRASYLTSRKAMNKTMKNMTSGENYVEMTKLFK